MSTLYFFFTCLLKLIPRRMVKADMANTSSTLAAAITRVGIPWTTQQGWIFFSDYFQIATARVGITQQRMLYRCTVQCRYTVRGRGRRFRNPSINPSLELRTPPTCLFQTFISLCHLKDIYPPFLRQILSPGGWEGRVRRRRVKRRPVWILAWSPKAKGTRAKGGWPPPPPRSRPGMARRLTLTNGSSC